MCLAPGNKAVKRQIDSRHRDDLPSSYMPPRHERARARHRDRVAPGRFER
jgi:hypothetical protein